MNDKTMLAAPEYKFKNPDIERARDRLLDTSKTLMAEGISQRDVAQGIANALTYLIEKDESYLESYDEFLWMRGFLLELSIHFENWDKELRTILELGEAIGRSRENGGNGNPIQ